MLDSFRKRDNPRDNLRPSAPGAPASRVSFPAPQGRVVDSTDDATRTERVPAISGVADLAGTTAAPRELQPVAPSASKNAGATARLIVGPDIKLKGAEITDCDTLIVEGQVDACMDSRVIEIAEHGIFRGTVHVDIADIRGRFEGELTAHKQLMIRASGHVAGKIRYGKMLIDEGGELSGDVATADPPHAQAHARPTAPAPSAHTLDKVPESHRPREAAPPEPTLNRATGAAPQR